jgi:hypothetical protein
MRQRLYILGLSLLECSVRDSLTLIHFSSVSGGLKWVGSRRQRLEVCAVLLLGLVILVRGTSSIKCCGSTYKGKTTVPACGNLRLVCVDEDPRVAERAATAVAGDDLVLCPAHVLLVDEFDGGVGLRLESSYQHRISRIVFLRCEGSRNLHSRVNRFNGFGTQRT